MSKSTKRYAKGAQAPAGGPIAITAAGHKMEKAPKYVVVSGMRINLNAIEKGPSDFDGGNQKERAFALGGFVNEVARELFPGYGGIQAASA